jgi:glycosyltransferase involved in cell wall biosynthesis
MAIVNKMEQPLVSVLMTAYNREKFIREAIESVLDSTYTHFELIIVDDGSSDATVAIARSYADTDPRVKVYVNEANLGDYPNRNRAASYAQGKYLKYLDSDDMIYRYGLEAFVTFMEQDEEAAAGFCYRRNISHQPFPLVMKPSESLRYHFFTEGFLDCGPTGTIIRRDYFEKLGGFSGKRMIGDLEFGLKVAGRYKVMLLPPALVFWRSHGDQEIVVGIQNNLYHSLSKTVLTDQFETFPPAVLTEEEKNQVFTRLSRSGRVALGKKILRKLLLKK